MKIDAEDKVKLVNFENGVCGQENSLCAESVVHLPASECSSSRLDLAQLGCLVANYYLSKDKALKKSFSEGDVDCALEQIVDADLAFLLEKCLKVLSFPCFSVEDVKKSKWLTGNDLYPFPKK